MPKKGLNVSLQSYDDIFSTEETRQDAQLEKVQQIPLGELYPFKNHPFKVIDDEAMLKGFTTDELRAELKRRNAEEKAKKESILRCRMCRHWGEIDYWGSPLNSDFRDKRSCVFFKTKNGKYYRCHNASQLACDHFERKEE